MPLTNQQLLARATNVLAQETATTEFTYVSGGAADGEIETMKEYPNDPDTGNPIGANAKLTAFSYDTSGRLIKKVITDTTVV